MNKEYFIGIDFGHGETSVSRVPGYNKETVSRVPLRITGHDVDKKVVSALCKHDDGWHFVWSQEDFKRPEIREGFKGMIGKLEPVRKEALGEFAKLVFRTILKNDEDLVYNEATGEANFSICIACPSDWRRQDPQTPQDYLEFFRDECGITPIEMCINESDAAFYTKYNDYSSDDTIFVIDLGSSTIDFTTYHHSECISDCCWGHNLGAHIVEDKIIETGYEDQDNEKNMRKAAEARRNAKLGSADAALSLAARFAKEKFYTNHLSEFEFEVRFSHLIPAWPSKREVAFSLFLSKEEFNHVIQDYSKQLESVFMNAAKKLSNYGIEPSLVLLSGGASRMDFVRDSAEKAFPNAQIYHDNCPEWVVSDGAAKYCKVYFDAQIEGGGIKDEFELWALSNLMDAVKDAGLSAFQQSLSEQMRDELYDDYVNNDSNTSVRAFKVKLISILKNVTATSSFKRRASTAFVDKVNSQIVNKLSDIIRKHFGKNVQINGVFVDPKDMFGDEPVETSHVEENVEAMAYNLFCGGFLDDEVNWDKERTRSQRQQLTDYAVREIPSTYQYNCECDVRPWIEEAKSNIQTILLENGLFKISL